MLAEVERRKIEQALQGAGGQQGPGGRGAADAATRRFLAKLEGATEASSDASTA